MFEISQWNFSVWLFITENDIGREKELKIKIQKDTGTGYGAT